MFAELPMYDLPTCRKATDVLWAGKARALRREGLIDVPDRLTRWPESGSVKKGSDTASTAV